MLDIRNMGLVDWYAGQALTALLAERKAVSRRIPGKNANEALAKKAFEIADAMLKERPNHTS